VLAGVHQRNLPFEGDGDGDGDAVNNGPLDANAAATQGAHHHGDELMEAPAYGLGAGRATGDRAGCGWATVLYVPVWKQRRKHRDTPVASFSGNGTTVIMTVA
jgi:hypothetical protein